MATPNPTCPSYLNWPGVARRRQAVEAAKPAAFEPPKYNPYIPADLQPLRPPSPPPPAPAAPPARPTSARPAPALAPERPRSAARPDSGSRKGQAGSFSPDDIGSALAAINGEKKEHWLPATHAVRRALSTESKSGLDERIRAVIGSDALQRLTGFLRTQGSGKEHEELQFEAAWALTNVASGTSSQCVAVVETGVLGLCPQLLRSTNPDMREQVIWLLGNVAGDGAQLRDKVVASGALEGVLELITDPEEKMKVVRQSAWLLSNVFRFKPRPDKQATEPVLRALAVAVPRHHGDDDFMTDACWAAAYIADGGEEMVAESALLPVLLEEFSRLPVAKPQALPMVRFVGNMVTGDDATTQLVVDGGVLSGGLKRVLELENTSGPKPQKLLKEACWALSNITAGTTQQARAAVDAGLLPLLAKALQGGKADVAGEAAWALANLVDKVGKPSVEGPQAVMVHEHVEAAVEAGAIPAFKAFLESGHEVKATVAAIEGLMNIAKYGAFVSSQSGGGPNPYLQVMADAGVYQVLQDLTSHGNNVSHSAEQFLARYPQPQEQ